MKREYTNKTLNKIQNFLDELKSHPERKQEIYRDIRFSISQEEIETHVLRGVIEKISKDLKDFTYEDILDEIEKGM